MPTMHPAVAHGFGERPGAMLGPRAAAAAHEATISALHLRGPRIRVDVATP
jgi:hypothetical protein